MKKNTTLSILAAVAVLIQSQASGQVAFQQTPTGTGASITAEFSAQSQQVGADNFTLAAGKNVINKMDWYGVSLGAENWKLVFYNNNVGSPGTVFSSLILPSVAPGANVGGANVTFSSPFAAVTFTPGTQYWISLYTTTANGSDSGWATTAANTDNAATANATENGGPWNVYGGTELAFTLYYQELVATINKTATTAISDSANTPNQRALAGELINQINAGTIAPEIYNAILLQTPDEIRRIIDQLTPAQVGALSQIGFSGSTFQFANMGQRFDEIRLGLGRGISTRNLTLYSPEGIIDGSFLPLQAGNTMTGLYEPSKLEVERWGFFINGSGTFGDVDSTPGATGYEFNSKGGTVGFDYQLTKNFVAGFMAGYTRGDMYVDANGGNAKTDQANWAMYATYYQQNWYADAVVGGAYDSYRMDRNILIGGNTTTATSDPEGIEFNSSIKGGYDFNIGNWRLGPVAGAEYKRLMIDSYSESGAGAFNMSIADQEPQSVKTGLGGKAAYVWKMNNLTVIPTATASWQHEFVREQSISTRFANGVGNAFSVKLGAPITDTFLGGFSVKSYFTEDVTLSLGYNVETDANKFIAHNINMRINVLF
ncbi:MAG: autotransporter outer membrane beta-barrel domain-containing protein [Verrucomicrobiota bacterium]|nr:autotransporter outer membrane beta-barrel domain-containing protein [Verrucomicrobiota bacterium]